MKQQKIVALVLGIVLVGGGLVYFYKSGDSPKSIILNSISKEVKTEQGSFSLSVATKVPASQGALGGKNIMVTASGDFSADNGADLSDIEGQKSSGTVNLFVKGLSPEFDNVALASADFVGIGSKTSFFKIKSLPPMIPLPFSPSEIMNKWVKIDRDELLKKMTENNPQITEQVKLKQEYLNSPEFRNKIKAALLSRKDAISSAINLGDDMIDGVNTYHFSIKVDKKEVGNLFLDVLKVSVEAQLDPESKTQKDQLENQIAEISSQMGTILKAIDFKNLEIWIGKDDLYVRKINVELLVSVPDPEKTDIAVQLSLSFKNINQPVEIKVPPSSVGFVDLVGKLIPSIY